MNRKERREAKAQGNGHIVNERQGQQQQVPMTVIRELVPMIGLRLMGPDEDGDFALAVESPGRSQVVPLPAESAKDIANAILAPRVVAATPEEAASAAAHSGLIVPGQG
jgi:hypothetical protein